MQEVPLYWSKSTLSIFICEVVTLSLSLQTAQLEFVQYLLSHSLAKRNSSFEFLRFIIFFLLHTTCVPASHLKREMVIIVLILCDWLNYKLLKQGSYNSSCYLRKISLLPPNKCFFFIFLYYPMFLFWKKTFNIFLCPTRVEETRYFRIMTRLGSQICGIQKVHHNCSTFDFSFQLKNKQGGKKRLGNQIAFQLFPSQTSINLFEVLGTLTIVVVSLLKCN